jgi:hypothetical protein
VKVHRRVENTRLRWNSGCAIALVAVSTFASAGPRFVLSDVDVVEASSGRFQLRDASVQAEPTTARFKLAMSGSGDCVAAPARIFRDGFESD